MKKSDRGRMPQALPLANILEKLLCARGMDQQLQKYRAFTCWPRAVGPQVAAQTQPVRIRDGVLEVRVAHPVWMQQLQLLKPRILAKLAEQLGPGVIRDLYLRQGRIERSAASATGAAPLPWKKTPLAAAEEEKIAAVAQKLGDPELRREFERLMRRQKQLEKSRSKPQDSPADDSPS